ncbi:MAG: Cof-type HAD-IIB family hydrolase [Bacillota bacterium]|nr:Cof-type HAD-IIB family hydrolase [Bacillota bacterium]
MIKCIASDMDGTLLNSTSGGITEENKKAILLAQSKGIEVVIATGRSYDEAIYLLEEAAIKCPVICVNGAEVRSKEGKVISSTPLNKEDAREAASKLVENEVYFEVYTNKGKYSTDKEKSISIIIDIVMSASKSAIYDEAVKYAEERAEAIHLIENYEEVFVDESIHIYKFLAFSYDKERLDVVKHHLEGMEEIEVSSSGHENLEITYKSAQKGIALEAFVREKGILLSETMAIGDNFNDVSMFKRVGRPVAMGNASEEIKQQCKFVTDTNENSGVAKAILEALESEKE